MGEEDVAGLGSGGASSAECADTLRLTRQIKVEHIVSLMIIVGSTDNERGASCLTEADRVHGDIRRILRVKTKYLEYSNGLE